MNLGKCRGMAHWGTLRGLGLVPKLVSGSLKLTKFPFLETRDFNINAIDDQSQTV